MILVDRRKGSVHLAKPLRKSGHPVTVTTLTSADVSMVLRGPHGRPLTVGIELKRFPDFLSSFLSKRLVGLQLPRMLKQYDSCWLILEGDLQPQADGAILYAGGSFMMPVRLTTALTYPTMLQFLFSLYYKARMPFFLSPNPRTTLHFISALYKWGQKDWDSHHSHLGIHQKSLPPSDMFNLNENTRHLGDVAAALPGVGLKRRALAIKQFYSIHQMINAGVKDWEPVCGPARARQLFQEVRRDTRRRPSSKG